MLSRFFQVLVRLCTGADRGARSVASSEGPAVARPKVFGVGIAKSGTKTLGRCFRELGYRNCSIRDDLAPAAMGNPAAVIAAAGDFDSFEDFPWFWFYESLAAQYPDARFVLTRRRDDDAWRRSFHNHMRTIPPERIELGRQLAERFLPGVSIDDLHQVHNERVRAFFADKPGRLLEVCWEETPSWGPLCAFLGQPVPPAPFPHENRGDYVGAPPVLTEASEDPSVLFYDDIIGSPLMRRWYGGAEYYNVGLWSDSTRTPQEASAALVDRLIGNAVEPITAVLDVGCGLGTTTAQIKRRWPEAKVVGINISPVQLDRCRVNAPDCEFVRMDAVALDFPTATFDLVTCFEAANHFNTREAFLREACRVLRPGGTLALSDMLLGDSSVAKRMAVWDVNTANSLDDPAAYADKLRATGFVDACVEDVTTVTWHAWLDHLNVWLAAEHERGTVPEGKRDHWRRTTPSLIDAVTHYVLASARKPSRPTGQAHF